MDFTTLILLAIIILFVSAFISSSVGFGHSLVSMPLLAMIVGIKTATPLVGLVASTINIAIMAGSWHQVDIRAAWRLILLSLVGIPLGIVMLKYGPEHLVKAILGVLLVLYGLYSLISPKLPAIENEKHAYSFGFVAGVLGGAYNTNGPPVVMYGMLRRWPPEHFRATLQCYFFFTGLLIVAGQGLAGLWTPVVLRLYLYSVPVVLLAIFMGGKINSRIPKGSFSKIVYAFLVIIGVLFLM